MTTMMIQSDPVTAQEAVQQLTGIELPGEASSPIEFSYTLEIDGMENARQVANQLLSVVGDFSATVLQQANQFPAIADQFAQQDQALASQWEVGQ